MPFDRGSPRAEEDPSQVVIRERGVLSSPLPATLRRPSPSAAAFAWALRWCFFQPAVCLGSLLLGVLGGPCCLALVWPFRGFLCGAVVPRFCCRTFVAPRFGRRRAGRAYSGSYRVALLPPVRRLGETLAESAPSCALFGCAPVALALWPFVASFALLAAALWRPAPPHYLQPRGLLAALVSFRLLYLGDVVWLGLATNRGRPLSWNDAQPGGSKPEWGSECSA